MITDKDVQKIRSALKPDFQSLEKNLEKNIDLKIGKKLADLEQNIHKYILDGIAEVVDRLDDVVSDSSLAKRVTNLEKLHPSGKHSLAN